MTPDPSEYNKPLNIHINNTSISTTFYPIILGLTFDPKLKFSTHTDNTITKAKKILNLLKLFTSTSGEKAKKHSSLHTKHYSFPSSNTPTPSGHPSSHPPPSTNPKNLSAALRTITGCTLDTNTQHLHSETKILPLQNHPKFHASQLHYPTPLTTQKAHPSYKKRSTFNNNISYTLNIPLSQTTSHTNKKQHENNTHKNSSWLHIIHSQQNPQQATPTYS